MQQSLQYCNDLIVGLKGCFFVCRLLASQHAKNSRRDFNQEDWLLSQLIQQGRQQRYLLASTS